MIKDIQDAIQYGIGKDFWDEESSLVSGYHDKFGEQLDCEMVSTHISDDNENAIILNIGKETYSILIEHIYP